MAVASVAFAPSALEQWDWGLRFESVNWQSEDIHTVTFQMTAPGLTAAHLRNAVNQGWYFGVRILPAR